MFLSYFKLLLSWFDLIICGQEKYQKLTKIIDKQMKTRYNSENLKTFN
ncbi:hypothetical protein KE3_0795 [Streptococcus lutetiensis 033]|uniref:Uncharacterized protein n=1 Tax=Streptococcus lutetiensis 033 TaxID=1076934 RepID=A0AB33ALA4_9STRE|nr:hypothetical protein KE3_0795 [Streptococcus lutetiensis 033]